MYRWIATGLILLAVEISLAGCGRETAPASAPTASSAPAVDEAREAALKAQEADLAAREKEVAAKQQELADAQAAADAAAAKVAASHASANKPAVAANTPKPRPAKPAAPVKTRIEVPSGTALTASLASDLSTKTAKSGDPFVATLVSDLVVGGHVALPAGARLTGNVTNVISGSKSIGAIPTLGLRINQIELMDGQKIPISGELVETGKSEKGRDTAKIVGGAAAGAIIGNQAKHNDNGRVIGGLLGGAIGVLAAKKTGTEVQLADGAMLTVMTDAPFTVEVKGAN